MPASSLKDPSREQLALFRALPFFSLAKSRRIQPIDFQTGGVKVRVEGTVEHGLATIWDADVLIWAASQIVEALDRGLAPSPHLRFTPHQLLRAVGRATIVMIPKVPAMIAA